MGMITFLKEHTPWAIRPIVRNFKRRLAAIEESRLATKEVFTKIYAEKYDRHLASCRECQSSRR